MKRIAAAAGCALLALVTACSSSGGSGPTTAPTSGASSGSTSDVPLGGTIIVLAASSLTEAFNTIAKQFEAAHHGVTVKLQYGASSDLSTQIGQGKPADVFASASSKNMDSLQSFAIDPKPFVSNTLEIAVPPSNPGKITQLSDLAKPGVKVGVCDPEVPCGVVAKKVFDNAKLTVKPVANLQDVKSTLAVVESGEVDAGLVYVTDVRSAGSKVKGIEIPADVNASTTYPIAELQGSKNNALSLAFIAYVLSADGQKVLTADGFSKP